MTTMQPIPKNFRTDNSDGISTVKFFSPPNFEDIKQAVTELMAGTPSNLRIWDFSCGGDMDTDEVVKLAEFSKSISTVVGSRVALIAGEDLPYGILRIYEVFRQDNISESRVVRTREEALQWLKS